MECEWCGQWYAEDGVVAGSCGLRQCDIEVGNGHVADRVVRDFYAAKAEAKP